MFNLSPAIADRFEVLYQTHHQLISTCDVFFNNIRLLNGRHTILTRDDFTEHFFSPH